MKRLFISALLATRILASDEKPPDVILDEQRVKLLGLETVETAPEQFEETVFAVGRIEVLPGKKAVLSSRISGRAHSVLALPDMRCDQGDELVWVESRQPGDPPPTVRLDAPIAGLISKVNIAQGQPIEPSDALVEIVDLSTVEATAAVPEHLAGKLRKGQKARIRVPAFPDKVIEAELVHLGAAADEASGTLEAAFHLPNEDELLRPGMRAEFSIITATREDVTTVPRAAVLGDAGARYVMIKHYELAHAFWKTPVSTGASNDNVIEITGGLNPGDEVVSKGAYSVAFAGRAVSLKIALDAAHGHPHNEDGSEMTKEQIAAAQGGAGGHDHDHDHEGGLIWKISTGVLAVLLLLQALVKKPAGKEAQ